MMGCFGLDHLKLLFSSARWVGSPTFKLSENPDIVSYQLWLNPTLEGLHIRAIFVNMQSIVLLSIIDLLVSKIMFVSGLFKIIIIRNKLVITCLSVLTLKISYGDGSTS